MFDPQRTGVKREERYEISAPFGACAKESGLPHPRKQRSYFADEYARLAARAERISCHATPSKAEADKGLGR